MISKELLSEVLGVYVRDGWYFDCGWTLQKALDCKACEWILKAKR